MSDCWFEKKYWFDYNAVNLSSADKDDFSNENHNTKQSINLNDHFILDYFYMFASAQLKIKSDSENAYWDTEFFDYISQL